MKTTKLLFAMPLIAAIVVSCNGKEEPEKESVNVQGLESSVQFAAIPAGEVTFTIETNVDWSIAKTNLDWLSVSPTRGTGKNGAQTVKLTAEQNKLEEVRSGSLTVTAGSFSKTVQVSQEAATVDPNFATNGIEAQTLSFAADETAAKTFQVSSNKDWKATLAGLDWATVTPLEGDKNRSATITVTPKAANDGVERKGTISFAYGADQPYVVTVTQAAFVASISLSPDKLEAGYDGSLTNAVVTVTANGNWTAKAADNFVTLDKAEGAAGETAVTVKVAANDKTEARSTTITFTNGDAKAELTVNQAAKPAETLEVSVKELEFAEAGEAKTVNVTSNAAWTVTSSESWLSVAPATGNGNATVTITAAANEGTARTATITVKVSDALSAEIAVSQKGNSANLINLETEPVVWCADSQVWNMENNPEFPGPMESATGYVESAARHGTGIVKPMNGADKGAYLEFIDGKGPDQDYSAVNKGKFIFVADGDANSGGGDIGFRQPWTNDAWVFHIPAAGIKAGKTICFDFSFLGTTACPKFWAAEVKISGEWVLFKSHQFNNNIDVDETCDGDEANGAKSNVLLLSPQRTKSDYDCTYTVTSDIPEGELQIRLRVVDGTRNLAGKAVTAPTASNTVRLIQWKGEGRSIKEGHGPTIYVK